MSWDVLIMKTDGKTAIHDMPKDYQPEPLGDADELRPQLSQFFADQIDWSDPAWGIFGCEYFSYEFNFSASGPVETFMLHVRGGGDAVTPLVQMCRHFGWMAVDCSSGDFIDLDSPDAESWSRFQAYRDKVVDRTGDSSGG
ncbi:hypothetical protein Rcae01_04848 [Novipirellula caenicola]|uniref:Uncharacterized protein n=2 Tax=Novipirellula caenicola TaxID=1536901 RepID=A0ABP9VW19_9BACT